MTMAPKGSPKKMPTTTAETEIQTKPVRVDLLPVVHKALRMKAAAQEMSMASLARKIITEHLGFKEKGGK
jgi:predicted HicB family RNase H-like nuclease